MVPGDPAGCKVLGGGGDREVMGMGEARLRAGRGAGGQCGDAAGGPRLQRPGCRRRAGFAGVMETQRSKR